MSAQEEAQQIMHAHDRRGDSSAFRAYGSQAQWLLAHHVRRALWLFGPASRGVVSPDGTPINPEHQQLVTDAVEDGSWVLLEEVNLAQALSFPDCPYLKLQRFLAQSSVDLLVVSSNSGAPAIPLLAIEFDGPTHEEFDQSLKDRLKDFLFADAGIPLLRVKLSDARPVRWDTASSEDYAAMARVYVPLLRVVRLLVNAESVTWRAARQDADYNQALDRRSHDLFGLRVAQLSPNNYQDLLCDGAVQDLWANHQVELHSNEELRKEMQKVRNLSEWLRCRGVDPQRVQNFAYERKHKVWTACADYRTRAGALVRIEFPPLVLRLSGASEAVLEDAVRHCYYEHLVAAIEDMEAGTLT